MQEEGFVIEEEFLNWMNADPSVTVWLTTMNRLAIAEPGIGNYYSQYVYNCISFWLNLVKHEAKCNICKSFPIVGLRFRCLKCLNMDLCQVLQH